MTTDQGDLGDDALHSTIRRTDHHDVRAAIARPPHPDPVRVNVRERGREGDGVAVVTHLLPRTDMLARLTATRAEVAIVEH